MWVLLGGVKPPALEVGVNYGGGGVQVGENRPLAEYLVGGVVWSCGRDV